MFKDLKIGGHLSGKQLNYYSFNYNRACNSGKLHVLPKTHKWLYNILWQPFIFHCGTPSEKASESLDNHLKPVIKKNYS